ncbi:MAG: hypothetical protein RLZZ144_959 [Pseudomonadota bacterium]|jgi:hypothetical protein
MDKKIFLGVSALVVFAISILLMAPDNAVNTADTLPWNITHPTPETSRILGITLGKTSLTDTEKLFQNQTEVEISLFKSPEGKMTVEAFFEEVNFNGLKAKMVITVAVPQQEMIEMFNRGLRMNSTPSGKRITLTADDLIRVKLLPIANFTYLPSATLSEAVITKRFGVPAERIQEKTGGSVHWLYPQHGLDVVIKNGEKPLLQYTTPKDFELLRAPLLADGDVLK